MPEIVERAREWVHLDERVLGAFVRGSAARGEVTPLSDVDLIVVARHGRREAIWAERDQISQTLLDAVIVEAHEVPHQRRFAGRPAPLICGCSTCRSMMVRSICELVAGKGERIGS